MGMRERVQFLHWRSSRQHKCELELSKYTILFEVEKARRSDAVASADAERARATELSKEVAELRQLLHRAHASMSFPDARLSSTRIETRRVGGSGGAPLPSPARRDVSVVDNVRRRLAEMEALDRVRAYSLLFSLLFSLLYLWNILSKSTPPIVASATSSPYLPPPIPRL